MNINVHITTYKFGIWCIKWSWMITVGRRVHKIYFLIRANKSKSVFGPTGNLPEVQMNNVGKKIFFFLFIFSLLLYLLYILYLSIYVSIFIYIYTVRWAELNKMVQNWSISKKGVPAHYFKCHYAIIVVLVILEIVYI